MTRTTTMAWDGGKEEGGGGYAVRPLSLLFGFWSEWLVGRVFFFVCKSFVHIRPRRVLDD